MPNNTGWSVFCVYAERPWRSEVLHGEHEFIGIAYMIASDNYNLYRSSVQIPKNGTFIIVRGNVPQPGDTERIARSLCSDIEHLITDLKKENNYNKTRIHVKDGKPLDQLGLADLLRKNGLEIEEPVLQQTSG